MTASHGLINATAPAPDQVIDENASAKVAMRDETWRRRNRLRLAWARSPVVVYAGCALFGLGVGNLTTLPGLILAVEWPREQFSALVGLVVGINQFTFAFGPSLVGVVRDWSGTYGVALGACTALQAIAAALVLLGPSRFLRRPTPPRLSESGASRRSR